MHTFEGKEVIGLGKMLKLDSFFLETEETRFSMFGNVAASMEWRKWREPDRQVPNQCCNVHSVAKFRFHRQIIM
jgi:hypothetical protein